MIAPVMASGSSEQNTETIDHATDPDAHFQREAHC